MRAWAIPAFCLLWLSAAPGQALAAGATTPDVSAAGSSVEMPYLIAPIIVDEKLIAYAYVSSSIVASSNEAAIEVRDKLAFIQDAFVRDVNAKPIGKPDDPATVDQAGLRARLLADAKRIMGPQNVQDLKILQIQVTPLRPAPLPLAGN